jgi:hypothetical protein
MRNRRNHRRMSLYGESSSSLTVALKTTVFATEERAWAGCGFFGSWLRVESILKSVYDCCRRCQSLDRCAYVHRLCKE